MEKRKLKVAFINILFNEDAPPMNLVYLGTMLEATGFCEVKIIDGTFSRRSLEREIEGLDCVGISAVTKYYGKACAMAHQIKERTGVPVFIGGSHITLCAASLAPDFDLGVIGEGERTIVELCKVLYEEGAFSPERLKVIPGLVYWRDGKLHYSSPVELIKNLDDIPIPDYRLLDRRYFRKRWIIWDNTVGCSMKLFTSRGCPYNCIFCASKKIWKVTRLHSAERIYGEVEILVTQWGIDHLYIDDDLFALHKERLEQFARLLESHGLNGRVAFHCTARTNLLDEAMCTLLKRIGVKALNFGFESGSDKVLKCLKGEQISVEDHRRAIRLCNKYGFMVWGSFMLGNPCETIEDMKKTLELIDFAIAHKCHKLGAFVATPFPGTPFWETAKQRGTVSDSMNWAELDYEKHDIPRLLHPGISEEEFRTIFKEAVGKADSMLARHNLFMLLRWRYKKIIRKTLENPRLMLNMCKNIFLKKTKTA